MNLPFYGDLTPYEPMRKKFSDKGIDAKYVLEEEWNLKAAGIGNPTDTAYSEKLIKLGYKYLLFVKGVEKQSSEIYSRNPENDFDPSQNKLYNDAAIEETTTKTKLYFEMFSLEQKRVIFATSTETSISPITLPSKNGGQTNINFSSDKSATSIAMKKTAKRLIKLCR
jgi:hypothetical protein